MGVWRSRARALATALGGAALAACARHPESVLAPKGPEAHLQLGLIKLSLWIMTSIFVVVAAPLGYILSRYRERRGDAGPVSQTTGHRLLETVWTAVPILLVAALAVPSIRDTFALAKAPPNALQVTVVGHQWWWEFDYPAYGIVTADEMRIPAGRPVALTLRSADVIHSFWVPALAGKQDTIPGRSVRQIIEAQRPGRYPAECAEFCGLAHSQMRALVVAETPSAFASWVHGLQHPLTTPQSPLAKRGAALFSQLGCAQCHTIDGTAAQGKTGPNLTGLGNRYVVVAGALQNNRADVMQWIHDPQAIIPGTVMPTFSGLTQQQLSALAAYLEGLK